MSGASIAAKVKSGLRKANAATGENPNPIYKEVKTLTGGDGITPPSETVNLIPLVDAIFPSTDLKAVDGTTIKAGDRMLTCNGDVPIEYADIIVSNNIRYMVHAVDDKTPAGVPLAYKAQVRRQ